jgi:hypothetical protein
LKNKYLVEGIFFSFSFLFKPKKLELSDLVRQNAFNEEILLEVKKLIINSTWCNGGPYAASRFI